MGRGVGPLGLLDGVEVEGREDLLDLVLEGRLAADRDDLVLINEFPYCCPLTVVRTLRKDCTFAMTISAPRQRLLYTPKFSFTSLFCGTTPP